jgi:hypothetical protein
MSNLKISRFAPRSPDDDGDMSVQLVFEAQNITDQPTHFILIRTMIYNREGVAVASSEDNEYSDQGEVIWEPGEWMNFEPNGPFVRPELVGGEDVEMTCKVSVGLYASESHTIGEVELPVDDTSVAVLRSQLNSSLIAPDVAVVVGRTTPDAEGDSKVILRCGIENISDSRLDRISMSVDFLDDTGGVESSYTEDCSLDAGSATCLEHTIWNMDSSDVQTMSKKIRISLAVYRRVSVLLGESNLTAVEEDWDDVENDSDDSDDSDDFDSLVTTEVDPDDPMHTIVTFRTTDLEDEYDPEEWTWEEAFEKRGFNDGDGEVHTEAVQEIIEEAGYVVVRERWGVHNIVITSIKKIGDELMPGHWDDPREFLPDELVELLDKAFPEHKRG